MKPVLWLLSHVLVFNWSLWRVPWMTNPEPSAWTQKHLPGKRTSAIMRGEETTSNNLNNDYDRIRLSYDYDIGFNGTFSQREFRNWIFILQFTIYEGLTSTLPEGLKVDSFSYYLLFFLYKCHLRWEPSAILIFTARRDLSGRSLSSNRIHVMKIYWSCFDRKTRQSNEHTHTFYTPLWKKPPLFWSQKKSLSIMSCD